jgi:hypothetical protein
MSEEAATHLYQAVRAADGTTANDPDDDHDGLLG